MSEIEEEIKIDSSKTLSQPSQKLQIENDQINSISELRLFDNFGKKSAKFEPKQARIGNEIEYELSNINLDNSISSPIQQLLN